MKEEGMFNSGDVNRGTRLIAEIGINHSGSLTHAKEIVDEFSAVGVSEFKTQIHCFDDEYHISARSLKPPNADQNIVDLIRSNSLTVDEETELHDYIRGKGLNYIATAFSLKGVEFLDHLHAPIRKIGSGEIGNLPLLRRAIENAEEVIASTGLHSEEVISMAGRILTDRDLPTTLLACTNLYPTVPEESNLLMMDRLSQKFPNFSVGFSDHTVGIAISLAAAARAASLIERHVCLDGDSGPDVSASLRPSEFKEMIRCVGEIDRSLHTPRVADVSEVERFALSSLVAAEDLVTGTVLKANDIWAVRPGTGDFRGWELSSVVGKRLNSSLSKGDFISIDVLDSETE